MPVRPQRTNECKCCGAALTGLRLDLGELPACNRFLKIDAVPETHPLVMAECPSCGLVQLAVYPPSAFVVPRVPWIRYREPETHLDNLAAKLMPSLPRAAQVLGIGPFDTPLLERLARLGLGYDILDLTAVGAGGEAGRYPYLETIQACLPALDPTAARGGPAHLVVCRYLLEHCHDPVPALVGLKRLLAPEGKLLIEVPDSEKFLSRADYSFIWEEHICYFSEPTLCRLATRAGFRVTWLMRYEGAFEDTLVAVLESSDEADVSTPAAEARSGWFHTYKENFSGVREAWQTRLRDLALGGRGIALLGVGHQAIMFVNVLGLQRFVSHVADDQTSKQGYYAPGIAAPIVPSTVLAADPDIGSWLLAVSQQSQTEVRTKFAALLERGLRMYSIFPESTPQEQAYDGADPAIG
jgi:hypothetical protein